MKTIKALNFYTGDMVSEIRNIKGISQVDLGVIVGLSRASIANIEEGRQAVSLDLLFKLSVYFNRPITDFLPEQKWYVENRDKLIRKVVSYIMED